MAALRSQMSGQISVEVDASPQMDLAAVMNEIREEYELIAKKNNDKIEDWYKKKVRVNQNPPKPSIHLQCLLLPAG